MRTLPIALALALSLSACGGAADPAAHNSDGYAALGSADYSGAAAHFEAALEGVGDDTSSTEYKRAWLGLIEANCNLDPAKAKEDFLALAKADPSIGVNDYALVGGWLTKAGKFEDAVAVVGAGLESDPEAVKLDALAKNIRKKAEAAGDEDALGALEGIGYAGGE